MKWEVVLLCFLQVRVLYGLGVYNFSVNDVNAVSSGDFNGDGMDDMCFGCYYSDDGYFLNGAFYIIFGSLVDPNYTNIDGYLAAKQAIQFNGAGYADAWRNITCAFVGDTNGDGLDDVILAEDFYSRIYLVYGSREYLTGSDFAGAIRLSDYGTTGNTQGIYMNGTNTTYIGSTVHRAGDINRDGYADFLLMAEAGIYIFYGNASTSLPLYISLSDPSFTTTYGAFISVPNPFDATGVDFNNDGFSDIAFTIPGTTQSEMHVIFGSNTMSRALSLGDSGVTEPLAAPGLVMYVDSVDMNGDGCGDLIVGGGGTYDGVGPGYIFYGGNATFPRKTTTVVNMAVTTVASAKNANGNGFGDAVFANRSLVVVVYGGENLPDALDVGEIDGKNGVIFNPPYYHSSLSVASGDLNHDGIDEVMVVPVQGIVMVVRTASDLCVTGNHNCSSNATCVSNATAFSYTCSNYSAECPQGFSGPNCTDVIPCPQGFYGLNCSAYCGNGNCDVQFNETCVSCFADCGGYCAVPPSKPDTPHISWFNRSAITVNWVAPVDAGLPIDNYTLSYSTNLTVWNNISVSNTTFLYTIVSLQTNTTYNLVVAANSGAGSSPPSDILTVQTAPEYCGDGVCDPTETCSTCYLDCFCEPQKCAGNPECSARGSCVQGVCDCYIGWSGPDCSLESTTIPIVNISNSSPTTNITLGPSTQNSAASFIVSFNFIREVDIYGKILNSFPLTAANFAQPSIYNLDGGITTFSFFVVLPNKAETQINISIFASDVAIPFANVTVNIQSGSVKYSMRVSKWPFAFISNRLQVGISSEAQDLKNCAALSMHEEQNNNLLSTTINFNGVTLYGRFLDVAILDGVHRTIQYTFDASINSTLVNLPHFWDTIEFDPNYQVLVNVNVDKCDPDYISHHKKSIKNAVIGGVVGGVVGIALVAAIIGFIIVKRHKRKQQNRIAKRASQVIDRENSNSVQMRKRTIVGADGKPTDVVFIAQ